MVHPSKWKREIPFGVLLKLKLASEAKVFESICVFGPLENAAITPKKLDPILVGIVGKHHFVIARWV